MIGEILATLALIGAIIGITGYFPQITHLVKVKNSTGISIFAWYVWFIGNFFLLLYAIYIVNFIYIVVEILFCLMNLIIIIMAYYYKK